MSQGANAENIQIDRGYNQIPHKIAHSHRLEKSRGSRIAPNTTFSVHGAALNINPLDPQGKSIDEETLYH